MSTGVDPASQQLVQSLVRSLFASNYTLFAIIAVLLYDTVAYFEEEVKYFWAKPRSVVSILYFVNRYGSILIIVSGLVAGIPNANETICRLVYAQTILFTATILCGDYILLLRVCALYSQGRMITTLLMIIFGLEALALIGFTINEDIFLDPFVFEFDGFSLCFANALPSAENITSWCVPLVYNTLLMVLALYKARQFWKESAGFKGLNLVKILILDQAFYFLAVNVVCFANILDDTVELSSLWSCALTTFGNPGLMSIVGCRLLLNMKVAGEKGLNQGISYSLLSISSNIEFAAPPDSVAETSLGNTAGSLEAEIQGTA